MDRHLSLSNIPALVLPLYGGNFSSFLTIHVPLLPCASLMSSVSQGMLPDEKSL